MADVKPGDYVWIWKPHICAGKLSLICGNPGLGKSMLTLAMAAHITRGAPWPVDGSDCPTGDVLMLSAEDGLADTMRRRLDVAEADVHRVHVLTMVRERDPNTGEEIGKRSFSLKRDIPRLDTALGKLPQCKLLVIDPISAFMDGTEANANADVRGLLAPLQDFAESRGVAVLAITHMRKAEGNAVYRTTGSIAFNAAARIVLMVLRDKADKDCRLVVTVKNNLGPDTGGFAYWVRTTETEVPYVDWGRNALNMTADEALAAQVDDPHPELTSAEVWLRDVLADGPLPAKGMEDLAANAGLAWRTVLRAKAQLKIPSIKPATKDGGWMSDLPEKISTKTGEDCLSR
ncbi:MAG TPA: AAA family ATPase [Gammaproteobacteria bacterium]|nr:AAA family ATPase [Gammaproteobacteria bacterium]